MLGDNIKNARKALGLSQEELAIKINVVRQTVSKWEKGLSVPDSDMLISLSEALGVSVNALLGEGIEENNEEDKIRILAAKLEVLNEQFARQKEKKRVKSRVMLIILLILVGSLLIIDLGTILSITMSVDKSVSIIGGADGPTGILVSTVGYNYTRPIFLVCLGAAAIIGLIKTRRN